MKKAFTKILSSVLALALIAGVLAVGMSAASAADSTVYSEGVYRYTVSDGKAKITDVIGIVGDVTLPSTLGGYPVTCIGELSVRSEGQLTNVVIPECVETIEKSAFIGCDNLETVIFENNSKLKSLGETAFNNCKKLKSVNFGTNNALESIGVSAFVNDIALETVILPENLKTIGSTAFEGCVSLNSINIPASVSNIGVGAFASCQALEKISVDKDNPDYCSDEWGIVYNKEKTKIVSYPAGSKRTVYVIPGFIENVERSAFMGSKYLEDISWINPDTEIGISAFSHCKSLCRATVPEGTTYLNDWIFNACFSLTEVNLPDSIELIDSGVFHWCTALESIELPSELEYIFPNAFKECTGLKSIVFPEGLLEIGANSFQNCFSLESIDIPENVTYIGATAFYQCYSLKEITIPESVKYIYGDTFRYCLGLEKITIPESVLSIYAGAFEDCRNLETIVIPQNVKALSGAAFADCVAMDKVVVDVDNKYFSTSEDGILFDSGKTKLVYYPANKTETIYTVPDTVTAIGKYAFSNSQNLATVVIPDSVTSIESYAFHGFNIREIYFEGTEEEWNAFEASTNTAVKAANVHFEYNGTDHVHDYSQEITVEPTCTANGKKLYTCSCGETVEKVYNYGTAKMVCGNESYEWVNGTETDCTGLGKISYCCTECGYCTWTTEVAKKSHAMEITVSETKLDYECGECGYAYSETIPSGAGYVVFRTEDYERIYISHFGDNLLIPETPEKEGLDFAGWTDENGDVVDLTAMPARNIVLTPAYEKTLQNTYGVSATFDEDCFSNGSDMSKVQLVVSQDENDEMITDGEIVIDKENGKRYEKTGLFNIKMTYEGAPVSFNPNKTVKLRIPLGNNKGRSEYKVVHKLSKGGIETFYISNPSENYQDDCLIIEVSGFSEFEVYAVTYEDVKLISAPAKTSYTYKTGSVDLSGIAIEITNPDGTKETVTDTSKMKVVGFDNTKIGTQTVTVECEGQIVQFEVNVSYAWWQWIIRILLLGFIWY